MQRKIETPEARKIYKIRTKTSELPFSNMKQNMHLTEFTTTGLKQVKHRIQTIHNWTQPKKNL